MPLLDQFESVFKAASKEPFKYNAVTVREVLVVTDMSADHTARFADAERALIPALQAPGITWHTLDASGLESVETLLQGVEDVRPDVIVTYRNLFTRARQWPYSLGTYVDVLTQATTTPVLLVPRPGEHGEPAERPAMKDAMVVTEHLTGSDALVSWAAWMTAANGKLVLAHIEDDAIYDYYMAAIAKIAEIDSDRAAALIRAQLLKEPADYIASCREGLGLLDHDLGEVVSVVEMGHKVGELKRLIDQHGVDLVVFNTKDDDQLAMHGRAYPLAIELRNTPLLML